MSICWANKDISERFSHLLVHSPGGVGLQCRKGGGGGLMLITRACVCLIIDLVFVCKHIFYTHWNAITMRHVELFICFDAMFNYI